MKDIFEEPYLLYIKGSGAIYGVPARNLTEAEAFVHGEARLLKSGLYVKAKPKVYETKRKSKKQSFLYDEDDTKESD